MTACYRCYVCTWLSHHHHHYHHHHHCHQCYHHHHYWCHHDDHHHYRHCNHYHHHHNHHLHHHHHHHHHHQYHHHHHHHHHHITIIIILMSKNVKVTISTVSEFQSSLVLCLNTCFLSYALSCSFKSFILWLLILLYSARVNNFTESILSKLCSPDQV